MKEGAAHESEKNMAKKVLTKDVEIAKELEYHIKYTGLKEGARLPGERELASRFSVQRNTVRSALEILLKKGILIRKPKTGYFVAPRRIEFDLNNFRSMTTAVERSGRVSKVILMSFNKVSLDDKLANDTLLPEGTMCYSIVRLRLEYDIPFSLERSYIVEEHVPGLKKEDVHMTSLSGTLRHKYRILLENSRQKITAVSATETEAELLRINRGEPLLRYEGLVYDRRGRLIEFFNNVLIMESAEFRIREFI